MAMPYDNDNPFSPIPRRRRDDADLGDRMTTVEAVVNEHRFLIERVTTALETLAKIEVSNQHQANIVAQHDETLSKIMQELPTLKLARLLVFTAALSLLGTSTLIAWNIFRGTYEQHAARNANNAPATDHRPASRP